MFYQDDAHCRCMCQIRAGLGVGSFPRSPAQAAFSPWLSAPFPACCGCTPGLGSKEGERKAYFKTDLFYAFVMKANLFSNVQCPNGIGQPREETGVAASWSGLHPAPLPWLLPSAHRPVCGGLVQPRASPRGRTCSRKSWWKDVVTLPTLDDPLGFSRMSPVEESIEVCAHEHSAMCSLPPSITCFGVGAGSFVATGATHECQSLP